VARGVDEGQHMLADQDELAVRFAHQHRAVPLHGILRRVLKTRLFTQRLLDQSQSASGEVAGLDFAAELDEAVG
jgi:hypothetical protein